MLPSTNQVCGLWKQQPWCFKQEVLSLWAQDSPIDRIHDESVASIGPQKLTNRIEITQKRQQMNNQPASFRYGTKWRKTQNLQKDKTC